MKKKATPVGALPAGTFVCSRASGDYARPCKEAVSKEISWVHRLNPENTERLHTHGSECNDAYKEWWLREGSGHREEAGCAVRDMSEAVWLVTLRSLPELMDFICKNGEVVIYRNHDRVAGLPALMIYDSYIE